MSKKWQIPVTWEMCGVVTIEADTLEEAIDRANHDDNIELPAGSYVDSSFEVSFDDIDCIRELYNNKESDEILAPPTSQPQEDRSNLRIAALHDYMKNEENLKMAAEKQQDEKRESLILKIRSLAPRIDELIATGNVCLQNKIPLTGQAFGMREGYDTNQFFTNSWSHLVGFVGNPHLQPCHIEFLGINGGGACGVYNFRTNGTDVFSVHENKPNDKTPPSIGHMERFLNSFDTFESSFYAYVDSVIDKQRKSFDKLISSAKEKSEGQTSPSVRRDTQNLGL